MLTITYTPTLALETPFYTILLDIDWNNSEAKYKLSIDPDDFYQAEIMEDQEGDFYFIHYTMFGNSIFYINQFSNI